MFFINQGTQALVRPGSPHSSISAEDRTTFASICLAKALVDSLPNPYDKEALRFKVNLNSFILCLCVCVCFKRKFFSLLLLLLPFHICEQRR